MPPSPGAISPMWNGDGFVEENMGAGRFLSSTLKEEAAKLAAHSLASQFLSLCGILQ